jgi:phage gp36-like protein
MAYATTADMIARFGSAELIRMTTPEGAAMEAIDAAAVARALDEASDRIDSYLRTRYAVPLTAAPASIAGACCRMARFDLARGPNREPTEQMRRDLDADVKWLEGIAAGRVTLDGIAPASPDQSGARLRDRDSQFNADSLALW